MISISRQPCLYARCMKNLEEPFTMRQMFLTTFASVSHKNGNVIFENPKRLCHYRAGMDNRAAATKLTSRSLKSSFTHKTRTHKLCTGIFVSPSAACLNHKLLNTGFQMHKDFHTGTLDAKSDSSKSLSSAAEGALKSPDTLIETWFYTVAPRGTLHLNLPFNTVVRPLNPQDYPDMDKAIIEIHFDRSCGAETPPSHELSHIGDLYKLDVLFDQDVAKMTVTANVTSGVTLPVVCILQIPLQSDLTAAVQSDKDLTVEKLEGDVINLSSQRGNCYLKGLKCGSVNVQSCAGDIVSRSTVLGNIIFHAGMSGNIQADKLQGSSVLCQTEMGAIGVKSMYAETVMVRTTGGSIQLGQCHGQMLLQAGQSDVKIGSLEGNIDASLLSGSVNLHLSRHSNSNIDIKDGDIYLSFPDGTSTDLDLDCKQVNLDKSVALEYVDTDMPNHTEGYVGERGKASIHARTLSGIVDIKQLDWIHSTTLAFKQD